MRYEWMVMMIKFFLLLLLVYVNDVKEEIDDRFDLDIEVAMVSFSLYIYAKVHLYKTRKNIIYSILEYVHSK